MSYGKQAYYREKKMESAPVGILKRHCEPISLVNVGGFFRLKVHGQTPRGNRTFDL